MNKVINEARKWTEWPSAPSSHLGQHESMFELLFERSGDAIWLLEPESATFLDCNQAAVELMRAGNKSKLLKKRPSELSPTLQPEGCTSEDKTAEVLALVEQNGGHRFEWTVRRFDGENVPLEVLTTPIAADGRKLYVLVSRDISERKRAEAALRESEEKFRLLFESSSYGMMLLDPREECLTDCNQAAIKMSRGGTKEWLLSRKIAELAPPLQPDGRRSDECITRVIERALRAGSQSFEWTGLGYNDEKFPMEVTLTPIRTANKTLLLAVSRDLTEQKKSESALRESQQLLASVADNISEAIYRTGPDHRLIFANRAYLQMSGYESLQEMQSIPREELYANPEDRSRLLRALETQGYFRNEEIEYIRRDGHHWWGSSSAVTLRDPATQTVLYHVGSVSDITERKRTERQILDLNASLERRIEERTQELRASEARLRTLVEHAPEAIVVFDGDTGRFLFGNSHTCRLYGIPPEKLEGLGPLDVSPEFQPDGRRTEVVAREKMDEALAGGTPIFEWMHRHPNGKMVPAEVRLVRLPGQDKNLLRASIIDTTERKRREKAQQAIYDISEAIHTTEDLNSLFQQIHYTVKELMPAENFYIALADVNSQTIDFPYMVDENGINARPLQMGEGLTGYVLRTGKALLAGPHNAEDLKNGVCVVMEGTERVTATNCGSSKALVWLGAPLTVRGQTFGVIAVQDYHNPHAFGEHDKQILTFVASQIALAIERKRANQALLESEHKFRALFAASSQGVMLHDEKEYLEVNPAAARILGYDSPAQLLGRHPRDTSPPFQPDGQPSEQVAQKYISECINHGSARFEWVARTARGQNIPLEVILTRIEWGGRNIIQAVINDISERKKAEAELLKSLAREKELGQLKSNFVSMVSHEFRTPLGVILSSAEILDSYLEQLATEERREQLESIQKNARRMASLMEEVLLLGMVEAGKMEFKPEIINFPAFCRHLIDELHCATDRKCPLDFMAREIPEESFTDKRLLQHIFTNLLSNAVKYSEPGAPVCFEIERAGTEVVCHIRDKGIGIPEPDLEWLFNAFYRGRNVGHVTGTGLGLTIVKRCVELHRGSIKVTSEVNRGTNITVRLPMFSAL